MPRRQAAAEAQWGVSAERAPVQGWIQAAAAHVDGSPPMSEMFDWYVGIDWASEISAQIRDASAAALAREPARFIFRHPFYWFLNGPTLPRGL